MDGAASKRKPAGAMLVFPLARNVSAQVLAIRARSRPICFKVREENLQTLSVGRRGGCLGADCGDSFIAPRGGQDTHGNDHDHDHGSLGDVGAVRWI